MPRRFNVSGSAERQQRQRRDLAEQHGREVSLAPHPVDSPRRREEQACEDREEAEPLRHVARALPSHTARSRPRDDPDRARHRHGERPAERRPVEIAADRVGQAEVQDEVVHHARGEEERPDHDRVVGGGEERVAEQADHEEHQQRRGGIRVERQLRADVPERVDRRRAHDRRQRPERVPQPQVQEAVVEEQLEQPTDVQVDHGAEEMARRIRREIRAQHGDERARREEHAEQEAELPAPRGDAESRRRAAFDEQHARPRDREAAEPEDAEPEDDAVRERVLRQQQREGAEQCGQQARGDGCARVPRRREAQREERATLERGGEGEGDGGRDEERGRDHEPASGGHAPVA